MKRAATHVMLLGWLIFLCPVHLSYAVDSDGGKDSNGASDSGDLDAAESDDEDSTGFFDSILQLFTGGAGESDTEDTQAPGLSEAGISETLVGNYTPSHAYQVTLDLLLEVAVLRRALGVTGEVSPTSDRQDKTAFHAYTVSVEVMEKAGRIQRRLGMLPVEVGRMPIGEVTMDNVHAHVLAIIEELRRVKRQLIIEEEIQPTSFVGGKAPSTVYDNLHSASILMDGLVGRSATINDVYRRIRRIRGEMELVSAELGVKFTVGLPVVDAEKHSRDVAQQLLRATYKVIILQSNLGTDASTAPVVMLDDPTPGKAYEVANLLLTELLRVKAHLGIKESPASREPSRVSDATEVFAQVLLILRNLEVTIRAAEKAHQPVTEE